MSKARIYPLINTDELQFQEVLQEIVNFSLSSLASEKIKQLSPITHHDSILKYLKQTEECMQALALEIALPITELENILPYLSHLRVKNYILPADQLLHIIVLLRQRMHAKKYIEDEKWKTEFPSLARFLDGNFPPQELLDFIDDKYDEKGKLKENASQELIRISRAINAKQAEIDKNFKSVVAKYRNKGILHETEESIRNGRRVITIDASHKRQIHGIFHDESSSGKTVYIEPGEMIPLNNDLFNLYIDREKERKRLLRVTAERIREIADVLPEYQNTMIWYEVIYAKARYARAIDAHIPVVHEDSSIRISRGYHPILLLKNQREGKETIPFSLDLHAQQRVLLVSGPNAGGKSILLKSVGLLQMMVQTGIPVPVANGSEFGIFQKFFIDIGDHQSVEDDLSTYSSHLENMKNTLAAADRKSIILFDEFGSGTDPQMGGAMAQAILHQLMHKKVYGLITTHYGNLKAFASSHKYIVNGALLFNDNQLVPTYQLRIGEPGSSYAYEIAKNIGLSSNIIRHAQKIAGTEISNIDVLLHKLQREKSKISEKTEELRLREKQLDDLRRTYDYLQAELQVKRKRMKMEAKENALQYLLKQKIELNALIKEVKAKDDLRKAEELKEKIFEEQKVIVEEIRAMETAVLKGDDSSGEIVKGSYVKMRRGEGMSGQVERLQNNVAQVIFGSLRMEVRLKDLQLIKKGITVEKGSTRLDIQEKTDVQSMIDIRGLDRKEATDLLESFLDKAIIADLSSVEVIHGMGTGTLRELTREIGRQYRDIKKMSHPPREQGGLGKTIVLFG